MFRTFHAMFLFVCLFVCYLVCLSPSQMTLNVEGSYENATLAFPFFSAVSPMVFNRFFTIWQTLWNEVKSNGHPSLLSCILIFCPKFSFVHQFQRMCIGRDSLGSLKSKRVNLKKKRESLSERWDNNNELNECVKFINSKKKK